MATKRLRGRTWHYTIKRAGLLAAPIYLSFADEAEGDKYVAHLESLLAHGIVPEGFAREARPRKLRALLDAYRETVAVSDTDERVLSVIDARIGATDLMLMRYDWCEQWIAAMKRRERLSPSTIRHHVGALARCLDWGCRKDWLAGNPLRLLPRRYATYTAHDATYLGAGARAPDDAPRDRRLLPGEHERILMVLGSDYVPEGRERGLTLRHRDALVLLYWWAIRTGMRLAEMYTLAPSQVDVARRTVFLDRTKNGSKRQVPLFPEAIEAWQRYRLAEGAGWVFPWWRGGTEADRRRTTSLLSRQWARIFAQADCPGLRWHDLRHEATCWYYEHTTLTDVEIAKSLGWQSLRVAMRYANLRASDLAMRGR